MKRALAAVPLLAALLAATPARAAEPLVYPYHPSFPVLADGKFTNLAESSGTLTIGLAHAGWSLAVPLLGEKVGGRKGLWIAGLTWMTASVVQQSFFGTPAHPAPGYQPGPEFRGDLLTKLTPCAFVLAYDLIRHGW